MFLGHITIRMCFFWKSKQRSRLNRNLYNINKSKKTEKIAKKITPFLVFRAYYDNDWEEVRADEGGGARHRPEAHQHREKEHQTLYGHKVILII